MTCQAIPKSAVESVELSDQEQWPIQLGLAPSSATFFDKAHLLIAADCTGYAGTGFYTKYMKGKITLTGCPKLDDFDYVEKITAILKNNNIKSVTVIRMDLPCCRAIANSVIFALQKCRKIIPWWAVTLNTDGEVVSD